jgi:hypothetical protein
MFYFPATTKPGVKRLEREADLFSEFTAEVKICFVLFHSVFMSSRHGGSVCGRAIACGYDAKTFKILPCEQH